MIQFTSGELLRATEDYIAHGIPEGDREGLCTMLGLKIARKWPEVQAAFQNHVTTGRFRNGRIWISPPQSYRPGIIYMVTQPYQHHMDITYLHKAFWNLAKWADHENIVSVALPRIDTDLGGLSWKFKVKPLMEEYFSPSSCRFAVYENCKNEDEASKSVEPT